MLTHTQLQFFVLLRSGLWNKPVDIYELHNPETYQRTRREKNTGNAQDTDVDWKEIYTIAREQTVIGLIADAIGTLPTDQRPPKPILHRFIMDKLAIERSHIQLNTVLNEVVETLNAHNIPHVLLKGQGVAQNYPRPTSRTCGDIDLYVGKTNYEQSKVILKQQADHPEASIEECTKHAGITIKGIEIEIHRITSLFGSPRINRKFQKYTLQMLDTPMNNTESKYNLERWNNRNTIINLPSPCYNAIFQIIHMMNHFINSGIGLRQVCDWIRFLYTHSLNEQTLTSMMTDLKLQKAWLGFSSLAHSYLGLPETYIPCYKTSNTMLAEKMLQIIFITGNFGHHDADGLKAYDNHYVIHKWKRFKYHMGHFPRIFYLYPQMVIDYVNQWFREGIKTVAKGLSK